MSSALVTDAPTLALAQVLERLKSVRHHHRMSILRLCIALVQKFVAEQLRVKRRPCQAACVSEQTTGLREVGIHER